MENIENMENNRGLGRSPSSGTISMLSMFSMANPIAHISMLSMFSMANKEREIAIENIEIMEKNRGLGRSPSSGTNSMFSMFSMANPIPHISMFSPFSMANKEREIAIENIEIMENNRGLGRSPSSGSNSMLSMFSMANPIAHISMLSMFSMANPIS